MNFNLFIRKLGLVYMILHFVSCSTDDIAPSLIEVNTSETELSEDNGSISITATLNASASEQIIIPIIVTGTATINDDYSLSASQIVINKGSDSGTINLTTNQDTIVEGIETIEISLGAVENAIDFTSFNVIIFLLDDDSDTDNDGVLDANDDCPNTFGEVANNGCPYLGFMINEVLYDPASGSAGDANGDGTRDANEDEFIEFFNSGPELDLSGYTISDSSALRHTFPSGTILPINGVLVLFGGGTPTGSFGGALVQTASEGQINMSNSGDLVTLADTSGNVILTFDVEPLSNNPNESYSRNPDLTGDFVQHSEIAEANGTLFSPGTKIDGSTF